MGTLDQLRELSERNCQFRCKKFEDMDHELMRCDSVLAFFSHVTKEIGDNMRLSESFCMSQDAMYGLSYLVESFRQSVEAELIAEKPKTTKTPEAAA